MSATADRLERRWHDCASEAGWDPRTSAEVGSELIAAWSESQRCYHDLRHLEHCLRLFDEHHDEFRHPSAAAFVLWHHDCVYDPRAGDNEERSAEVAEANARRLGIDEAQRERIRRGILATRHGVERELGPDERLIVDIDLAILGADEATYDRFERDVRAEYAFVPWQRYREGRRRILAQLAEGDGPFGTPDFQQALGGRALQNLRRAIERLDAGIDPTNDGDGRVAGW